MNSFNSTVQIFAIFGLLALIYFAVCFTLSQFVRAYQKRLAGRGGSWATKNVNMIHSKSGVFLNSST